MTANNFRKLALSEAAPHGMAQHSTEKTDKGIGLGLIINRWSIGRRRPEPPTRPDERTFRQAAEKPVLPRLEMPQRSPTAARTRCMT
jgi:hypothetical protein